MQASNGRAYIAAVKAANPIEEIATGYTQLSRDGQRRLRGLCPLHHEQQPSFVVYPGQGRWWCYGACQRGGDVIDLVMAGEGLSFPQALDFLAARGGVERIGGNRSRVPAPPAWRAIQDVLALAVTYYQAQLGGDFKARALLSYEC